MSGFETSPRGSDIASVECFELSRSRARQRILAHIESYGRAAVKDVSELRGAETRKINAVGYLKGLRTQNVSLPAYILAYRYKGKLYRVVINGQDASVSCGEYPVSAVKVIAFILAVLIGFVVMSWISLILLDMFL